jgi:uncharacterized membrane protein YphA (DoxX/SURF4 family)
MEIVTWILQVLLAVVFLLHGAIYVLRHDLIDDMIRRQGHEPGRLPDWFRLFIGFAEFAAGVGLIAPAVTHILPWLVPLSAFGLLIVMVSATVYHVRRHEPVAVTVVLALMSLAVVFFRWLVVPIS